MTVTDWNTEEPWKEVWKRVKNMREEDLRSAIVKASAAGMTVGEYLLTVPEVGEGSWWEQIGAMTPEELRGIADRYRMIGEAGGQVPMPYGKGIREEVWERQQEVAE